MRRQNNQLIISAMVIGGMLLLASPCLALWNIGKLTNNWKTTVLVGVPVTTGTHSDLAGSLPNRGNLVLSIPGQEDVIFIDKGHNTNCSRPYWGVAISYDRQEWGFYYDGEGRVDVIVDQEGTVSFEAASEGSQVVVGSDQPTCRVP